MNRRTLCASFARQSVPKAKASNLYFEGRTAYSYGPHYPLAHIVDDHLALVNSSGRSVSTSIHTGAIRYALSVQGYTIANVPYPLARDASEHRLNVAALECAILDAEKAANRARTHKDVHERDERETRRALERYRYTFADQLQ